ncbi:Hypothetical_protein [Hexamita inflata]|uniref:Hypothetical_protein n=1 Tax=Hexamita inflata TaxID=28002 RepID=A0AA86NX23_9EUKA|nr:Hypothetical protein HINF_LOCUS14543 [Hexamita inflata]
MNTTFDVFQVRLYNAKLNLAVSAPCTQEQQDRLISQCMVINMSLQLDGINIALMLSKSQVQFSLQTLFSKVTQFLPYVGIRYLCHDIIITMPRMVKTLS